MNEDSYLDWSWEDRIELMFDIDDALDREDVCDFDEDEPDDEDNYEYELTDWANGYGSDAEVDADALASAGLGCDEDYGFFGGCEDW